MRITNVQPAAEFDIKAPIWNGGKKTVGLARYRLSRHNVVRFIYRRKSDGMLSIPGVYYFDGTKYNPSAYKHQVVGSTQLVLVPFSELELLEGEA